MQKKVDEYTYKTSDVIGYGSTSVVYLGNSIYTGEIVAIRVINLARLIPEEQINLQNQLSVLNYLPYHPNIVKVHKLLKTQNHFYVVTEYCDAKLEVTGNYDVNVIADGIIEGIKHLIKNNVIHRDLKPQNIMLKNGVPKLIDFGFARRLSNINDVMYEYLGSPYYMSPQILQQKFYTSKSDIWSLGVLLYQILYKVLPYDALTADQLLRKIKTTAPIIAAEYNPVLATLIQGCLIIDESKRYSWQQVFILASQLKKGGLKQKSYNSFSPIRYRSNSSNQSMQKRALRPIQNNFGYGF